MPNRGQCWVKKSEPEEEKFSLLAFSCRYEQVGENASAVLLSVVSAIGLTVKEKLGGERECGTDSERKREREREWEVPDSVLVERGG